MGQSNEEFRSRQNRYQNFQGINKLGDSAFKEKQYEKAAEYYKKALSFLDMDHHQYKSTLDNLKIAEQCIYGEKCSKNNKKTFSLKMALLYQAMSLRDCILMSS